MSLVKAVLKLCFLVFWDWSCIRVCIYYIYIYYIYMILVYVCTCVDVAGAMWRGEKCQDLTMRVLRPLNDSMSPRFRHDSQCIQAGAWLQKWQAAPKTRSEFERWADFKLSFKWSFWQPVCFALVTKMEWIRMDRYWTSRNCASSEGLGFAWPNQLCKDMQRPSKSLAQMAGKLYDQVVEHNTFLHVVTCSDLDHCRPPGLCHKDWRQAGDQERKQQVCLSDTAVHTDSSTRTNTNTIASGPLNSKPFSMML